MKFYCIHHHMQPLDDILIYFTSVSNTIDGGEKEI